MPKNIPNKAKLTAFRPVRVPKVKDIFKRIGYRNLPTPQDGLTADYSRNPLEHFDRETQNYNHYLYDVYAQQMADEAKENESKEKAESQEKTE